MSKLIKETLIKALADGRFVSGQDIADNLNVSRAAVAKHIRALEELGLDLFKVTGKGYRLAKPVQLLDEKAIKSQLNAHLTVEVHHFIDSTNSYLLRQLSQPISQGQTCLAEYQQAGRGRRGRQWISPFGANLYLSMYWRLEQGLSAAMGLSTLVAIAIAEALKQLLNLTVQLKWPNDIYIDGKKLAGILIDLEGQHLEACHSVIGIGLNIDMPKHVDTAIEQPYTDLQRHVSGQIDRNTLASTIINCLYRHLLQHPATDSSMMIEKWKSLDYFYNKPVKLLAGENKTLGICKGINNQGALLLDVDGNIKTIYGGEVSLRGQDAPIS